MYNGSLEIWLLVSRDDPSRWWSCQLMTGAQVSLWDVSSFLSQWLTPNWLCSPHSLVSILRSWGS